MKGIGQLLLGMILVLVCFPAKADRRAFGNSPGSGNAFNLEFESGNTFGGAVLFTPADNISLCSVTMWLSDYNGQNGIIPSVSIYSSQQQGPGNYVLGQEIAALDTPAPNDGSTSAFNFANVSGQTMLDANTAYWLFAYGIWSGTTNYGGATCYWEAGNIPTGDAAYNQADIYVNGSFSGQSAVAPAFVINAVPEPSPAALLSIPLLFGIGRKLFLRRHLRI